MMRRLVPKLRFDGFSGEWEEKSLEEVGNIITGNTPKTSELDNYGNDILFVSPVDISEHRYINETNKKLTHKGFMQTRPIKVKSILTVCIGSTIGKVAQNKLECATNQQINSIIPYDEYSNDFLYSTLEKNSKRIKGIAGNHAVPIINKTEFSSIKILIPSSKLEQQKIANTLSSLDNLIEAQKKKVEALKKHKKGLMQQLFPREGEKEPKLRFEGFDGEWEEKHLAELATLTSSKRIYLYDYVDIGIPFYRGKEISELKNNIIIDDLLHIKESKYIEIKKKYGVPVKNDILMTAVGTLGNILRIKDNKPFYFKDGNLIWLKNIKINSHFLEYLLNFEKNKILNSAIGSSQKALTMLSLNKIQFILPKEQKEQQKIANTLSSLDNLIEAQNKKIEALNKHKKGLMQGMFVSA